MKTVGSFCKPSITRMRPSELHKSLRCGEGLIEYHYWKVARSNPGFGPFTQNSPPITSPPPPRNHLVAGTDKSLRLGGL